MTALEEPDWLAAQRIEALAFLANHQVEAQGNGTSPAPPRVLPDDIDLDDLLDTNEPEYDWLCHGLLERGDRVILTGPEGGGKSTLLRQLAVQLGSGLHPFTDQPIDPLNVLYVDCENSRRQTRRRMHPLRDAAAGAYRACRIIPIGGAIDVADPAVEHDLAHRITTLNIDILIVGPLYKMNTGDPIKEEPAKRLADALDRLRAIRGSALLIEAHTPYAEGARTKRPQRPYGASLWSRWPEYGIYLDPKSGELHHWRGQREEREWPTHLTRSEPWPWAPAPHQDTPAWDGPTQCMAAALTYFRDHDPDGSLSARKIGERMRALGASYRDTTIRTSLEALALAGDLTSHQGPRGSTLYALPPSEMTEDELF